MASAATAGGLRSPMSSACERDTTLSRRSSNTLTTGDDQSKRAGTQAYTSNGPLPSSRLTILSTLSSKTQDTSRDRSKHASCDRSSASEKAPMSPPRLPPLAPGLATAEVGPQRDTHRSGSTAPSQVSVPGSSGAVRPSKRASVRVEAMPELVPLPEALWSAHQPFVQSCQECVIDRAARDWNEEFQALRLESIEGQIRGVAALERTKELLYEFEAYSQGLVERFFAERVGRSDSIETSAVSVANAAVTGAKGISLRAPDCLRFGNVVLRVWRSRKLAQNMQRCFSALLEVCPAFLYVPLTATFRRVNVCVSVQALIPLRAAAAGGASSASPVVYRGDGTMDAIEHRPTHEFISFAAAALNMDVGSSCRLSDAKARAAPTAVREGRAESERAPPSAADSGRRVLGKITGVEVVEGLDTRLYVVNAIGLLPSVVPAAGGAAPLRRWGRVVRGAPWRPGEYWPPREMYRDAIASAEFLLSPALTEPDHKRGERMIGLLHENGLNVCLLGPIALSLHTAPRDDISDNHEQLLRLILVEILARVVRVVMDEQMNAEHAPGTLRAVSAYLTRVVASLLDIPHDRFVSGLMPRVASMFVLTVPSDASTLAAPLQTALADGAVAVTQRVCQLSGLQMLRGTVSSVTVTASKHNYRSHYTAQHESFLLSLTSSGDSAVFPKDLTTCLLLPLRANQQWKAGRFNAALMTSQRFTQELSALLNGCSFVNAAARMSLALLAASCGEEEEALKIAMDVCRVMDLAPARVLADPDGVTSLPTYFYYLHGQTSARVVLGYVACILGSYSVAETAFNQCLRITSALSEEETEYAAQLRLNAYMGLFEVAFNSADVDIIANIDHRWEAERRFLPPSRLGSRISELLGSLLLEQGAYELAATRLWECFETRKRLRGERSSEVAEILNKLGYVYYAWDAGKYGVYSSCLLRQAEDIAVEVSGLHSPQHICIMENIAALFICRGRFAEASRVVHTLKTLRPQYASRIPRDHPVALRLPEIEATLREHFRPVAIVIIQRHWREHVDKMLINAVLEDGADEIQRVGRGFIVRCRLAALRSCVISRKVTDAQREAAVELIRLKQHIPVVLSFSKALLNSAVLLSKSHRNWNCEFQQARLFNLWWDAVEGEEQRDAMQTIYHEFVSAAETGAAAAQRDPSIMLQVPGCATSFVVQNIVFTRVSKGSELAHWQNALFQRFRSWTCGLVTATLSAIIEEPGGEGELYAEALIPMPRRPQYVFTSDGRLGPQSNEGTPYFVHQLAKEFAEAGFCSLAGDGEGGQEHVQGLEMVRGMDEQHYVTNALGLVFSAIRGERSDWRMPTSFLTEVIQGCRGGKAKTMTEALEKKLMVESSQPYAVKSLTSALLACMRSAAGLDRVTTHKYFQAASADLEESGQFCDAILVNYHEGRAWIRDDCLRDAVQPLLRNFYLLQEKLRVHSCFGASYVLESARWLLVACEGIDKPFDSTALQAVISAIDCGELCPLLFTLCERFIAHFRKAGNRPTLDVLVQLRLRRAQELSVAESERYVRRLEKDSEDAFRRGGNDSYRDCAVLLVTAIHLAEVTHDESAMLARLLSTYGSLLTTLNDLKHAQKCLVRAHRILAKASSPDSPEMFTWRKNNRTLKNRLRENAVRVIRRAVIQWKERRRQSKELQRDSPEEYAKAMSVQLARRMNRLLVHEATRRVLITEEEGEAWYQLRRKQRRGRNEAILRQTYGSRVQVHVDKLESALQDVVELAMETKADIQTLCWECRQSMLTSFLFLSHRVHRREVIAEWREDQTGLKLWHVEGVDAVIRTEFAQAYGSYLLRCAVAEEKAWRKVILKLQKKSKKRLGRYIIKSLRSKPKKAFADFRALDLEEERERDKLIEAEDDAYQQILDSVAFGPEIMTDSEDGGD